PAAREAGSREPRGGDCRMAGAHAGRGARIDILRGISRDESPPAPLGRWSVACGDARRSGPSDTRLAGPARREVLGTRVRGSACAVRRIPRSGTRDGAVPMSAYPLTLEGTSISALVVGAGRGATRKAPA